MEEHRRTMLEAGMSEPLLEALARGETPTFGVGVPDKPKLKSVPLHTGALMLYVYSQYTAAERKNAIVANKEDEGIGNPIQEAGQRFSLFQNVAVSDSIAYLLVVAALLRLDAPNTTIKIDGSDVTVDMKKDADASYEGLLKPGVVDGLTQFVIDEDLETTKKAMDRTGPRLTSDTLSTILAKYKLTFDKTFKGKYGTKMFWSDCYAVYTATSVKKSYGLLKLEYFEETNLDEIYQPDPEITRLINAAFAPEPTTGSRRTINSLKTLLTSRLATSEVVRYAKSATQPSSSAAVPVVVEPAAPVDNSGNEAPPALPPPAGENDAANDNSSEGFLQRFNPFASRGKSSQPQPLPVATADNNADDADQASSAPAPGLVTKSVVDADQTAAINLLKQRLEVLERRVTSTNTTGLSNRVKDLEQTYKTLAVDPGEQERVNQRLAQLQQAINTLSEKIDNNVNNVSRQITVLRTRLEQHGLGASFATGVNTGAASAAVVVKPLKGTVSVGRNNPTYISFDVLKSNLTADSNNNKLQSATAKRDAATGTWRLAQPEPTGYQFVADGPVYVPKGASVRIDGAEAGEEKHTHEEAVYSTGEANVHFILGADGTAKQITLTKLRD